jgi:hypothetical protein
MWPWMWFLAFLAIAVGAGVYLQSSFSLVGDRQDKVVLERPSPNEAYVASVMNSFGGATVSNSTAVCIWLKGEQRKETSESVIFRVENITKVGIHRNNNKQLAVDYDPGTALFRTDVWRGVVSYVEHRSF